VGKCLCFHRSHLVLSGGLRTLHDSIDNLTDEGERRHVSLVITGFITKIDFGRDLEQALNLYVDCRAAFANLDMVLYGEQRRALASTVLSGDSIGQRICLICGSLWQR
jgi:hypothetical protein